MSRPIILHVVGRAAPAGTERAVEAWVRAQSGAGIECHVAVLLGEGPMVDAWQRAGASGVHVLGGSRAGSPMLGARLGALARRLRPSVVHSHEMHASVIAAMMLAPILPWVATEHVLFSRGPSPRRAALLWRLARLRLGAASGVSMAAADELLAATGMRSARITPPTTFVAPRPGERAPGLWRVVAGGRMVEGKGWVELAAAARELLGTREDVVVEYHGDGPLLDSLAGLEREFPGRFSAPGESDDFGARLAGADVLLLGSEHESFSLALLEALAAGVPVAGFLPEGGPREIIHQVAGEKPMLLQDRDPAALARALGELLDDAARRAAMADAGREAFLHAYSPEASLLALSRLHAAAGVTFALEGEAPPR